MSRLDGTQRAQSISEKVHVGLFVEMIFDLSTDRLWTGPYDISWGGNTWTGAGGMLGVSRVPETSELKAHGVNVVLSGVPTSMITTALDENYQGRTANLYYGFFDDDGAVIGTPTKIGGFIMDVMRITEGGDVSVITMSLESRLAILDRVSPRRLTFEDQLLDFPGDLGLEFIASSTRLDPGFGIANISGGATGTTGAGFGIPAQ